MQNMVKPNKKSFFIFKTGILFFFILALLSTIVLSIVSSSTEATSFLYFIPVVFVALILITYFFNTFVYKKEEYIFEDTKVIFNYGTIFSDNSVNIKFDKITEVSAILGFWQYLFFRTGDILIKTAGSSTSKIIFKSINNPLDIYEKIQESMRHNGYHLQKDKLVQMEKPHWLGIFSEILQGFGSLFIAIIFFAVSFMGDFSKEKENTPLENIDYAQIFPYLAIGVGIILIAFIIYVILKYLDLKRRKYEVFTDSIFYTEGFLTKNYSFLPMERVSDCENRQGFFSKIFGLHDIVVSSEGSNNQVIFNNMVNGETMMKNIKFLKNDITMNTPSTYVSQENTTEETQKISVNTTGYTDKVEKPFIYNKDFEGKYKMNPLKTFLSSIVALVSAGVILVATSVAGAGTEVVVIPVFFAVGAAIGSLIKLVFTTYSLEKSSIESRYSFLSNKHNSFSVDKVTQVKISESLLDMFLGTCSVKFFSIGSSSNITFSNIKKTENLKKDILEKVGIYEEQKTKLSVKFTFMDYIKSQIGTSIFFCFVSIIPLIFGVFMLIFGEEFSNGEQIKNSFVLLDTLSTYHVYASLGFFLLFVIFISIFYVYRKIYFSSKFYHQNLSKSYIESIEGIFFRTSRYVRFDNIKGIISTKYPLTTTGYMVISVAGSDIIMDNQENKGKGISIDVSPLSIKFVKDTHAMHDSLDNVITNDTLNAAEVMNSKQAFGNTLVPTIVFAVIFTILGFLGHVALGMVIFVFSAILILIEYLYIKMKFYKIEKDRILSFWGIIYKSKQSIVFEKFNFVEKNQGFFGKIFKNGSLSIYTLGSGSVDMKMEDIHDFHKMYDVLKK